MWNNSDMNTESNVTVARDLVVARLIEPYLGDLRARNDIVWGNPKQWVLGFYFGVEDSRLWVPRRCSCGAPRDQDRVINFGHPLGRKAFRILIFAYGVSVALCGVLAGAALGYRW